MKNRSSSFESGLRIAGVAIAIYLVLFAALWADMEGWKTRHFQKLPREVQWPILVAFAPITCPLDWLGLLSK